MKNRILVLFVLVALVAAACGGGGDDETTSDEATPDVTVEPTDAATEDPTSEPTDEPTEELEPLYWDLLEIGTCFDDPPNFEYDEVVEPVDCAELHDNEIYDDAMYPAGSDPYPGEDDLFDFANENVCTPSYESFMNLPAADEIVPYFWIVPDEETWAQGDRRIICAVYDDAGLLGTAASAGLQAADLGIVHVSRINDQVDLYVSAQGMDPQAMTDDAEEEVINQPAIGADGRIVYARYPLDETTQADILAIEVDGEIRELLATPADESYARLSPDGTKIVYHSNEGGGEYDIWVMDSDGSNPTKLTTNPDRDGNPSWSPDGSQILYRARENDVSNIWIMNADGSDPVQLTDDPGGDYDPVFSPDGTQIAFSSDRDGNFDVWVMDSDGSNPTNLTNHPAADEFPAWTPDGAGIAFTSDRISTQIWIMLADGSEQTLFTIAGPTGYGTVTDLGG